MPLPNTRRLHRVLMPHQVGSNRFLLDLAKSYHAAGLDVIFGRDNLRHRLARPDVLHLHWPEEQYRWSLPRGETPAAAAERFVAALDDAKRHGVLLIWQVHNLVPHDSPADALDREMYQSVIDRSDILIHHCEKSRTLLADRYTVRADLRQLVLPLGNYVSYKTGATREQARERLRVPTGTVVFLHFGQIRAYKGFDLLLREFRKAQVPDKLLLVAGRYRSADERGSLRRRIDLALAKRFARDVDFRLGVVPEEDVEHYFNAADVVVLSHREGLNSGVAVLGMSFGKPVVGPDIGCLGWVLRAGRNAVYDPADPAGLRQAMERAAQLDPEEVASANLALAESWSWDSFVARLLEQF